MNNYKISMSSREAAPLYSVQKLYGMTNGAGNLSPAPRHSGMFLSRIWTREGGFTLIELLVVVLIIGILAAVAVPQYQKTVLKAQYSTLKSRTRALAQAQEQYHLANGAYATELAELDIDFAITNETKGSASFYIYFADGSQCELYWAEINPRTICQKKLFGTWVRYAQMHGGTQPTCSVVSLDTNDMFNNLCKKETGKTTGVCPGDSCSYSY